jgi:hypothetical protein
MPRSGASDARDGESGFAFGNLAENRRSLSQSEPQPGNLAAER